MTNLDMDVLRTLAVAMEHGSFAEAATRLGRSQSAVSLQMRRLEDRVGQPLFRKQGRNLVLTEAGDTVLHYARRILALNDEAVAAAKGISVEGSVRLGIPQDFAETGLTEVLARFANAHPSVHVEVRVDRMAQLYDHFAHGRLDLALLYGQGEQREATRLATVPIVWIGKEDFVLRRGDTVPLVLFDPPCLFRQPGIAALEQAGIPWRLAFTSPSLFGLWAAVDAGLGITIRTPLGLPRGLGVLGREAGLPALPSVELSLHTANHAPSPAVARLREILLETLMSGWLATAPTKRASGGGGAKPRSNPRRPRRGA